MRQGLGVDSLGVDSLAVAVAGAVGLVVWLACLISIRIATRPIVPVPDPAWDGSPPSGSPALAVLLVEPRGLPRRALTATLLDLAVRGNLDLSMLDGQPWVMLRTGVAEDLTPYERILLDHVARHAGTERVPLAACVLSGEDATASLWASFAREVADEAVREQLREQRSPRPVRYLLRLSVLAPLLLLASSVAVRVPAGAAGVYLGMAALLGLWVGQAARSLAHHRANRHGLALARRWAAARARATDDPPPLTLPVTDPRCAHAVALGAVRWPAMCAFHKPDRGSVWSNLTGTWRRLSVRTEDREGWREPWGAVVARAAATVVAVPFLTLLLWGSTDFVELGPWRLSWIVVPVAGVTLAAFYLYTFRDTWHLARDFMRKPVVELGNVVYTEHVPGGGEGGPEHNYVAVDDGTGDVLTLWDVPASTFKRVQPGTRVQLIHTPRYQGFRALTALAEPAPLRP